ncbi:unnamed protein product [Closterium sp. NIES-53]
MRQLEESALVIATLTAERDSARQQSTVNTPAPTHAPAQSEEPIIISSGTPTQNGSVGQRLGAASEGAAHSMPGMERNRTTPSPREPRESRRHVEFAATSGEYAVTAPMPLKPQSPPCFDPSQRGGPTVQSWVFTMNVFFDANYVELDAAKIRYAVSLLRGPAMDWWRVIVTSPCAYEPPSQEDGPTGPAVTWSSFCETAQYSTWDAWCAGLRARFEPIVASISARQKLRTWRQLGSVQYYTSGFLALCEQVGYMHEAERVDRYVGGLKPDISHENMLRGLLNLNEILALAEKIDILRRPRPGSYYGQRPRGPTEHATVHAVATNATATPFKGRCFACNRPGHRKTECLEELRCRGTEQGRESQRPGNARVNTATARKLQLTLSQCLPEIDARLVDGTPLAIREKVERVKVRCGGNFGFTQEMLATTLDGHDILLGRDWLRRYNPRIDWMTSSCTVRSSGNWVELPRWQSPESSTVHVNAITMKRAVAAGADVYAVDIAIVEEADKPSDFQKLLEAVPSELQDLLKRFPGIFLDDLPEGLPPQRAHNHRIELEPGAQPTVQRQFRLTQSELDELRKQLDYLLEKKFIRTSSSPFAAPILFTPKRDGGFRMCIDYRALNKVTVKSRYPIPRADELIDQLRTARVFSKIDLRGGYHQIRVEPSDCAKTDFRTRYGSFEYTVMPFGLTNAPATFQMTMNEAFRPLLDKCVIIYLDGILVYSRDKQQHLADLEAVFTVLDKHRLLTKGSKCEFFQDRLEFLGYVISEAGVEIDPKKLDTVKAWHPPTNITELQSFLGFVNYVRRFVPDMARLTAPLTDLLRKGVAFTWGEKEHAAFSTLKNVLCSPPVLRIADPHRPFEVVTDASDIAIGAVLLQDFGNGLQPIAYESRKLHPPEKIIRYTIAKCLRSCMRSKYGTVT